MAVMFERFTDDSRAVVVKAREEAQSFQHDHIGTEHVLLGLLGVPGSLAAQVLRKAGVGAADVRRDIEARIGRGAEPSPGHISFTPRAKKVLELSLRESLKLNVNYIGTEHILLALEREGAGLGAQILTKYVPDLGTLRQSVRELSGPGAASSADRIPTRTTNAAEEVVSAAQALAGGAPMGSHHLLEALVRAEGSMAAQVLKELGVDPAAIATKVDEFDTELTTDASQEEIAARKMELRLEGDEVHVVFRDEGTVGLAKAVAELAPGPIRATGPVTGQFVPLWKAANEMLFAVLQSLRGDPPADSAGSGKAALLVRRVLHDRLRGRDR
jgi:ATP-dependent Clp protease ATP-binding subunit ClpA